jgi:hypothetical protein
MKLLQSLILQELGMFGQQHVRGVSPQFTIAPESSSWPNDEAGNMTASSIVSRGIINMLVGRRRSEADIQW